MTRASKLLIFRDRAQMRAIESPSAGSVSKMDTIKPRLRRSPTLRHSPPLKHCYPSVRSESVCSVNCFKAEWGIRRLVVSTESRSPRRKPRRRDDSLGVFGVSDNQFFIKLTHHRNPRFLVGATPFETVILRPEILRPKTGLRMTLLKS